MTSVYDLGRKPTEGIPEYIRIPCLETQQNRSADPVALALVGHSPADSRQTSENMMLHVAILRWYLMRHSSISFCFPYFILYWPLLSLLPVVLMFCASLSISSISYVEPQARSLDLIDWIPQHGQIDRSRTFWESCGKKNMSKHHPNTPSQVTLGHVPSRWLWSSLSVRMGVRSCRKPGAEESPGEFCLNSCCSIQLFSGWAQKR